MEAITETFISSFETLTFLPPLHTHDDDRSFIREAVLPHHEVWVAEQDGRVVGFAAIGDVTLGHIYVHPGAHGRGLGSALLAKAKQRRPDGFTLWTFQKNEGARRFYERHGLRAAQFTDGAGNEEKEPDVQYEWRPSP